MISENGESGTENNFEIRKSIRTIIKQLNNSPTYVKMAAYHGLPEQVLSINTTRYLVTRNAAEKELLRKTYFVFEKTKSEEQKGFERERDRLFQRRSKIPRNQTPPPQVKFNLGRNILCKNEVETEKWEVGSDSTLFPNKRQKWGIH